MAISSRIANIPRSGIREIFELSQGISDVISLGIGEPNFDTPDHIKTAAKDAIDEGYDKYTQNVGIPELREEISKKLNRENQIESDPEKEVIVTAGATQAIFLIMGCLLEEGDEVMLLTPAFTAYEYAARLAGGVPIQLPLKEEENYKFDLKYLTKRCSKRTKILVLNSPCNPTGLVYSKEEIEEIAKFALDHNLQLVSDEIYEKYVYNGAKHFSPASRNEFKNHVITINGFSKTFAMTGWRLGYAVARSEVISAMTRFNMYNSVCPNSIAQKAGVAALSGSLDFFKPILEKYSRARKLMCSYLDKMQLPYVLPRGAFYIFPNVSKVTRNSVSYCKKLLQDEHVATVPGSSFGEVGEAHLRLSYSLDEEHLATAMGKIERFNKRIGRL